MSDVRTYAEVLAAMPTEHPDPTFTWETLPWTYDSPHRHGKWVARASYDWMEDTYHWLLHAREVNDEGLLTYNIVRVRSFEGTPNIGGDDDHDYGYGEGYATIAAAEAAIKARMQNEWNQDRTYRAKYTHALESFRAELASRAPVRSQEGEDNGAGNS